MADTRLRRAARAAESGDTEAAARLLLERVRAGRLSRDRLELAAYCGSEPARLALGLGTHDWKSDPALHADTATLDHFLRVVARWGGVAICLAATAAADAAYQADEPCSFSGCEGGECRACDFAWKALEAAWAWIARQTDETEDRFLTASASVHNETVPESHRYAWLPTGPWAYDPQHAHNREAPLHAARIAGEQPVREAIRAALTRWALDGEA